MEGRATLKVVVCHGKNKSKEKEKPMYEYVILMLIEFFLSGNLMCVNGTDHWLDVA